MVPKVCTACYSRSLCQHCTAKFHLEIQLHLRLQVRHTEKYLMVSRCRSVGNGCAPVLDHGEIQTCCILVKSRCPCNQGWTWHPPVLTLFEKLTTPWNPNKYSTSKQPIQIAVPCVLFHRKRPYVWLSLHITTSALTVINEPVNSGNPIQQE